MLCIFPQEPAVAIVHIMEFVKHHRPPPPSLLTKTIQSRLAEVNSPTNLSTYYFLYKEYVDGFVDLILPRISRRICAKANWLQKKRLWKRFVWDETFLLKMTANRHKFEALAVAGESESTWTGFPRMWCNVPRVCAISVGRARYYPGATQRRLPASRYKIFA